MSGPAERKGRVAAFFDVDGTLLAGPSLELRFFWALRYRRAIPAKNYLLWLAHAVRLAPYGMATVALANKMYLRGVGTDYRGGVPAQARLGGQASSPHVLAPSFFPDALSRVAWHAAQRHAIVLVTGTLAPLAHEAAVALTLRLAARGLSASIGVCATRLEEVQDHWTGRILGDAMFGEAKARAVRGIGAAEGFDLNRSYAYGDTASDRWILAAVGRPAAVNPSPDLSRIARLHDWPVLFWNQKAAPHRRKVEYTGISKVKTESLG
jgi:HAD superfamily hydrolase (TIGR01490 family)